ncbi:MAG: N-6 DNA methylase, partial [Gemmatimonadaceae bacterium]
MLTIRAATTLLAQADGLDALANIARCLGFDTPLLRITAEAGDKLGIAESVVAAHLGKGVGILRIVTAELASDSPHDPRELTRRICHALARNAPTRLWCVATLDAKAQFLCLACVTPHQAGPRVAALRVDRRHIVDSDADTLRAMAGAPRDFDRICHARWTDILKRDALSARFYRTLERLVHTLSRTSKGVASREERDELALLCASRLLFLAFLEAKGWLAGDRGFLLTNCSNYLETGGRLHERLLRPLFFGTLNTPISKRAKVARAFGAIPFLNGGLFSPTRLEQRRRTVTFNDDALTALIGELLDRFRFTAREDSSTWSEAAVDPEMLGRAFECLMASDERRKSGSFYTPPSLVEQTVHDALHAALPSLPPQALAYPDPHVQLELAPELKTQIHELHIVDPACGSGAFLVHMLERLAELKARAGDTRPIHILRREILTRSIFGVDRNPLAVWLCELRLWLSVVIECPETQPSRIPPLPNLDHHIRIGDTLSGGNLRYASNSARALTNLRTRYTRATGSRKRTLALALDHEERERSIAECARMISATNNTRLELLQTVRRRDLFGERTPPTRAERNSLTTVRTRLREQQQAQRKLTLGGALPFRFAAHFADVAAKGFDIVIGNPPWVRPHNLPFAERTRLRAEYRTLRDAAWRVGATRAGAGAGFAAQADLAVAFVERGAELLKPNGVLALLLPAKLWRALAGGGVRRYIAENLHVHTVRDWSDAAALFDAAVYPSLLIATRNSNKVSAINEISQTAMPNSALASFAPTHIHVA